MRGFFVTVLPLNYKMSFEAASYFTLNAIQLAKHFISQNDGSEIVLVGKVNESGQVYELKRAAMGNSSS
ncbi:MAG TPA: hypothetical protein PLT70_12055, partial [bacterium]|nr:hypothetical protein [bacterium]